MSGTCLGEAEEAWWDWHLLGAGILAGGQHIFLPLDHLRPLACSSLSAQPSVCPCVWPPEEADGARPLPGGLAAFQPPEQSPAAWPRSPQGGPDG